MIERIEPGLDGNPVMIKPEKPVSKPKTAEEIAMDIVMGGDDSVQGGTEINSPIGGSKAGDIDLEDSTTDSQK